jgi:hypothetical protein
LASLSLCISGFALLGIKAMPHNRNTFVERFVQTIHFVDSTESSCFATVLFAFEEEKKYIQKEKATNMAKGT